MRLSYKKNKVQRGRKHVGWDHEATVRRDLATLVEIAHGIVEVQYRRQREGEPEGELLVQVHVGSKVPTVLWRRKLSAAASRP